MPVLTDYGLCKNDDGVITIELTPPTAVGGWSLRTVIQHRFGGISGVVKSCASGYIGNVSGMNVVNSGQGIISFQVNGTDTSGMEFIAQTFTVERMDSGFHTQLAAGWAMINPAPGF